MMTVRGLCVHCTHVAARGGMWPTACRRALPLTCTRFKTKLLRKHRCCTNSGNRLAAMHAYVHDLRACQRGGSNYQQTKVRLEAMAAHVSVVLRCVIMKLQGAHDAHNCKRRRSSFCCDSPFTEQTRPLRQQGLLPP